MGKEGRTLEIRKHCRRFLSMLFLIWDYAVNNLKIFELYLSYFIFFFKTALFSTSYSVFGITRNGQHWLGPWSGLHPEAGKLSWAGKQNLASWDAWLTDGSCPRGLLTVLSSSLNPAHAIIHMSVGRTTLGQATAWTPVCEPHRHHLCSLRSQTCHDVICCGQTEDWSKLLGFSYLRRVCVTNRYPSLFWQLLLRAASNKQ